VSLKTVTYQRTYQKFPGLTQNETNLVNEKNNMKRSDKRKDPKEIKTTKDKNNPLKSTINHTHDHQCCSLKFNDGPLDGKTYFLCGTTKEPFLIESNGIKHEPKKLDPEELELFNRFFPECDRT
jgi:hypothetical protein